MATKADGFHTALNRTMVEELLRTKKDMINDPDAHGFTPIMRQAETARCGQGVDTVQALLDNGADCNVCNPATLRTAYHVAALNCTSGAGVLHRLIKHDTKTEQCTIDQSDRDGCTPLILAASVGNIDAVVILLQVGTVRINQPDKFGRTAMMACPPMHELVFLLVQHDAQIDAQMAKSMIDHPHRSRLIDALVRTSDKMTPAWRSNIMTVNRAVKNGATLLHLNVQEYLQSNTTGIDVTTLLSIITQAKLYEEILNHRDARGLTPLHFAVMVPDVLHIEGTRCYYLVNELLQAGADPTVADNDGHTIVHYVALRHFGPIGTKILAAIPPEYTEHVMQQPDKQCRTPLIHAAIADNTDIMEKLLNDYAVDMTQCDIHEHTALMHAMIHGNISCVTILHQRCSDTTYLQAVCKSVRAREDMQEKRERMLHSREQILHKREQKLQSREQALQARTLAVHAHTMALQAHKLALQTHEQSLQAREQMMLNAVQIGDKRRRIDV